MDYKHTKSTYVQKFTCKNGGLLSLLLICAFCNVFGSKPTDEPNQTNDKGVCSPNPCANGGSCMNENNDYKCYCTRGFMGELCQIDIDECLSNPCPKKARCIDGNDNYTCVCKDGYTGEKCAHEVDECDSNPCKNEGKCVDGINIFWCACKEGYTGNICDEIDECASDPCENNGTCVYEKNDYRCECPKGFTGKRCETEVDECDSNPCKNEGKCVDGLNTYRCACKVGYIGDKCQEIDECASNPCENDGTCVDLKNKYRCKCPKGFTGKRCETDIDECASNPCKNGGSCHDDIGKYICICENDYRGDRCQRKYKIDPTLQSLSYFDLRYVLITAFFALVCVVVMIRYGRNWASENTFVPNFEHHEWSRRGEDREGPRYRSPPESTASAEERARDEEIFKDRREATKFMFEDIRRQEEQERYIKKRREEHLKEYDEKVQKVETSEYSNLSITDIPWPSEKDEDDDKIVLFGYMDMSTPENKKYLRHQQIRWHPDKFFGTFYQYLLERDKEAIMSRVTLLSQEINTIKDNMTHK